LGYQGVGFHFVLPNLRVLFILIFNWFFERLDQGFRER
jgi:hypothetical protein